MSRHTECTLGDNPPGSLPELRSADIWDSELYNETVLADAIVLHFQGEEIVIWQRPDAEIARRVGEEGGEYRSLSIDVKNQADIDYWRSLIDQQKDGDDPWSSSSENPPVT